ncbi:unannotated protein [freshwater metagenome]|uniref:Unannotated protein n=1 Tax=freshwater metagenome TaxID=449393 RepID=A0A6J7DEW4_9ZZZZ|nr:hypothetical protein [Actinomycetota bacterium]MUH58180.1 hypothetical protein [Actinomycetota bacterium]
MTETPQTPEEAKRQIREIFRQMGATYRAAPRRNRLAVQLVIANIVMWPFVSLLILFGG